MSRKKIVLFNPQSFANSVVFLGVIPYSLLYLERSLRGLDVEIIIIDQNIVKNYKDIIDNISDDLLFVGVTALTGYQLLGAMEFSVYIRTISNCDIVWGGWHPSLLPEQVLKESFIDYIIIGQGELPLRQFTERKLADKSVDDIAGLAYENNGEIIINPREPFKRPDYIGGEIDFSLVNPNSYVYTPLFDANRCISFMSSHGCPYKCAFCSMAVIYDRKWYGTNIDCIIKQLKLLKELAEIDSVSFSDSNFFVDKDYTIELCKRLIDENVCIKWNAAAHASSFLRLFSDEDVNLIYRSGCKELYIGAESGDQEVLDVIGKHAKVEDNLKFVEILAKHNITPKFSTMICFPMNPDRDIDLTFDMIRKATQISPLFRSNINFYTPYPGTDLYELACKSGFKPPETLKEWSRHTPRRFRASWEKEEYRLKAEIFANFYLPLANPDYANIVPPKYKIIAWLLMCIFHRKARKRFENNDFNNPYEAILFLKALNLFNRIFRTRFSLGSESLFKYPDEEIV